MLRWYVRFSLENVDLISYPLKYTCLLLIGLRFDSHRIYQVADVTTWKRPEFVIRNIKKWPEDLLPWNASRLLIHSGETKTNLNVALLPGGLWLGLNYFNTSCNNNKLALMQTNQHRLGQSHNHHHYHQRLHLSGSTRPSAWTVHV